MAGELILMADVEGLGRLGEQVRVANGYARNYLLPRGYADRLTPENLRRIEAKKLRLQQEHEERVAVAKSMAEKINAISVTIPMQAQDTDKLYGSVTPAHIVNALREEGIEIDSPSVILEEPIRELGVYTVDLQLHDEVQASLKVWVVRP